MNDVFFVTQSFFKFHNEVMDNLDQLKIERVSKNFAQDRSSNIEEKVRVQTEELLPLLQQATSSMIANRLLKQKTNANLDDLILSGDSDSLNIFNMPLSQAKSIKLNLSKSIKEIT